MRYTFEGYGRTYCISCTLKIQTPAKGGQSKSAARVKLHWSGELSLIGFCSLCHDESEKPHTEAKKRDEVT